MSWVGFPAGCRADSFSDSLRYSNDTSQVSNLVRRVMNLRSHQGVLHPCWDRLQLHLQARIESMVADNEWIFQSDTGSLAEKHSRLP